MQGRVKQITEPDGSTTQAFYNEAQRPDAASSAIGNTTRVVDAWGRERWGRYDQQGRLAEVVEPNPNGNGMVSAAGSLVTKYTYNTLRQLVKTEQGVQVREFKYDSLGRLIRQKLAEQTATINDGGAFVGANGAGAKWSEAFVYDNRSNLVQKTDPRGVKSNYSYIKTSGGEDALNRLQAVSYDTSGTSGVLYAPGVSYQYMTTGDKSRIQQIRTDGFLTETYAYDVEGRVSDYTEVVDYRTAYPMVTSYMYDSLDRTTDVRYPAEYGMAGSPRKLIQPTYDTASRLTTLKVDGQQQAGDIVYNSSDQTESIKIGTAGNNQVTESYQYDNLNGLLTNQKVQRNGTTLLDLSYDYARNNSVGNLSGKTGHLTKIVNNLDTNKNREYEFDALGRLTKAKGGTNNLWTQTYSYDRYGNRTNVAATGVAADNSTMPKDGIPNLTYDNLSNRITNSGVQYDVAGNQTRALAEDGSTWLKYEYDAANRLQLIRKDSDNSLLQAFQFGSSNQRLMDMDYGYGYVKIFGNGGAVEYTEFTGAVMTWSNSYTYLGDSMLSTITPNGTTSETTEYNHPDHLGTRLITNQQTGSSVEQATLPFGTALNSESTRINNPKRFTSYERSVSTGLDYAINRSYDSKLGRFTQVDPIRMGAATLHVPQTLNLYNYCGNDPINRTDSIGLSWLSSLFKWFWKKIVSFSFKVAIQVAVAFVLGYIFGGIPGAVSGAVGAFFGALGRNNGNYKTPSFNPNIGSISVGSIGGFLIKYGKNIINNLLPCPPNIGDLIDGKGALPSDWFGNVIKSVLAQASKDNKDRVDAGQYKEVGGWILISPDGQKYEAWIKPSEPLPKWELDLASRKYVKSRGDNSTSVLLDDPRSSPGVGKRLDQGWLIIGDFHSHANKIKSPGDDQSIANQRRNPGVWIYPDGSTEAYGPKRGILGKGVPKRCPQN